MCSSCFIGKAKSQSHFYFSTYLSVPFRRKKEQSKRGTGRKSEKELERESGRKAEGGLDVRWLCCGAEHDDDDDQSDDDYSLLSLSLSFMMMMIMVLMWVTKILYFLTLMQGCFAVSLFLLDTLIISHVLI